MKKFLSLVLASSLLATTALGVRANDDLVKMAQAAGYPATAEIAPKSAILVDGDTGQVIWGHNIDLQWSPASISKTMVIYLVMEAVKAGQISMDTEVVATETDQAIAGIYAISNNNIVAGVSYTVSELLSMTFVPSSNVATLMLAHLIFDGTDGEFVALMNQTAQKLGMTNTVFHNATGAESAAYEGYYLPEGYDPEAPNLSSAKDLAILTYHLLKNHPEIVDFTDDISVTVKAGTPYEETFHSYNHSLPDDPDGLGIAGVDGLKTGSSPIAAYNAIVTAKRDGKRLINVTMGVSRWEDQTGEHVRHYFVNGLLEHMSKNYELREVLPAGQHLIDGQKYELAQPLTAYLEKGTEAPQVKVKDGVAVLDQVSGILADGQLGVPATPVKGFLAQILPASKQQQDLSLASLLKYLFFIILVLIIALLLLIISVLNRRQKH